MRNIPKFAFLSGEGLIGIKVICLEYPYIIGSVFLVNMDDQEKIDEMMTEMVQSGGVAKVRDFSVFVKCYEPLEPCKDKEYIQSILNEMAEYVREKKIMDKVRQFKAYDEKGIIRRIIARDTERSRIYLTKKAENKEDK